MATCHNMHHSSRVMSEIDVSTAYIGLFPHFLTTSPGRAIVVAQRLISAGLTILELSVVLKLEIVLKFYSFGQNVLKLTFVMLS